MRKGISKKCLVCSKKFYVEQNVDRNGFGKFCSHKCCGIFQREEVERKCETCGIRFKVNPCYLKNGFSKFCSVKCYIKFGKNNPNWRGGKIKKNCIVCGKNYYIFPAIEKLGKSKFCSTNCCATWTNKHNKTKDTSIELLIGKELRKRGIKYQKQVIVGGISVVDFLLPHKIIIQADGLYWHSKPKTKERDSRQDNNYRNKGYKVFRFGENDIKESVKKCVDKINL